MASFFASPPFLSHPIARSNYLSSSQTPNQQPSNLPPQQLNGNSVEPPSSPLSPAKVIVSKPALTKTKAESTHWIASTLTRRFGVGAGLAWFGFLAVGVITEQIKTRLEVSQQQATTRDVDKQEEVVLPNGIRYYEKRALALVMGSRPYSRGICEGVEYVLRNMKAGGKRRVIIPPSLGFGEEGADLGEGLQIPPLATLEYVIDIDKVSIAPA
ncbi:hypothetical protein DH2020_042599 [Rehmannia glutinosa]|uniref:peptidylprolyl isomerase n=1 Tax=Rehmannia glutinosa TaxID=99300 RepID=A0ABR0UML8_REHGL